MPSVLISAHPEMRGSFLPLGARRLSFSGAPTAHPCADGAHAASMPLLRKTTVWPPTNVQVVSERALISAGGVRQSLVEDDIFLGLTDKALSVTKSFSFRTTYDY
jgi:hypothetical protein